MMSKAIEISDRVFAVGGPGLSGPEDCCVYLVDASSELVLIDTGAGFKVNKIEKNIQSAGFEPAQIWHIIVTHCHIDHIGGLKSFVQRYGSKVVAHELDREGIEGKNNDLTAASLYGIDYQPVKIDNSIKGDNEILNLGDLKFNLIHTPGHTPGSMSPYIDTKNGRVLFGQDIHGPFSTSWGSNIAMWRASMEKLLALNVDILCEGHFGIFQPKANVERYIKGYLKNYT
jgi:glyoxylase-like metal-dependent hydrolase (beta-lactamase superfamily II)